MNKLNKFIPLAAIAIGSVGFVATMNLGLDLFQPRTLDEAARKWCDEKDGKFFKSYYTNGSPECEVERFKGKAGIPDGTDEWEFYSEIVSYDTGLTHLFVIPKRTAFERYGLADPEYYEQFRQYKRSLRPALTYYTKGKNN